MAYEIPRQSSLYTDIQIGHHLWVRPCNGRGYEIYLLNSRGREVVTDMWDWNDIPNSLYGAVSKEKDLIENDLFFIQEKQQLITKLNRKWREMQGYDADKDKIEEIKDEITTIQEEIDEINEARLERHEKIKLLKPW